MDPLSDATARLREAAWRLAEALIGGTRQAVLGRSLEIQSYLYFCWNSTRPWWIFRRCVAASLLLCLVRELHLIQLQRRVIERALRTTLDVHALGQAIDIELTTRRTYQLGSSASPAAANLMRRAAEDGLPMRDIGWLLRKGHVSISDKGQVEHRTHRGRRAAVIGVLAFGAIWTTLVGVLAYKDSPTAAVDLTIFLGLGALTLGYFGRQVLSALKEELKLVNRLKGIRAARSMKRRG
jgi:hypothetical protein